IVPEHDGRDGVLHLKEPLLRTLPFAAGALNGLVGDVADLATGRQQGRQRAELLVESPSWPQQVRGTLSDEMHVDGSREPHHREPIWVQRGGLPVDAAPRSSAVSGWCALTYATRMSRTAMPPYRFGAPSSMVSPSPPLVRKSVTATVYVPGAQEASHASPLQLRVSQRTLPASSTIRTTIAPSGGFAF